MTMNPLTATKEKLPIKVIQFGEGNFLRAFVDWMIQKMNDQNIFNGQVAVVQPLNKGLIHMLEEQNCNYTHFLKGMLDKRPYEEHYVNKSIGKVLNPYKDFQAYLKLAHHESASIIISNTTEAGIEFKATDTLEAEANISYPGKLTRLLLERFTYFDGANDKGFILMPCELIDNNADKLKECVLSYIDLWNLSDEFKNWVLEANSFCNTLVDRIVPGFPRDTIDQVWEKLGYKDNLVVESELFNLWVVQGDDKVRQAFPAKEAGCNLLVVDDVTPFKKRKVRILNGAHTSLVPMAYLYGKKTVKESVEDPVLEKYLNHILFTEIIPTLTLSKEELESFAGQVLERFKNPFIKHYLISISLNSMSKYRTRVLPSLETYLTNNNQLPKGLTAALAALIVFYSGKYNGEDIPTKDNPDITKLYTKLWAAYDGSDESLYHLVEQVLGYEANWQGNLNHLPGLTQLVTNYVSIILNQGMSILLKEIIEVS